VHGIYVHSTEITPDALTAYGNITLRTAWLGARGIAATPARQ